MAPLWTWKDLLAWSLCVQPPACSPGWKSDFTLILSRTRKAFKWQTLPWEMLKISHLQFRPHVSPDHTTRSSTTPPIFSTHEKSCTFQPPQFSHTQRKSCTFTISHEAASEFLLIGSFLSFLHIKFRHQATLPWTATVELSAGNW